MPSVHQNGISPDKQCRFRSLEPTSRQCLADPRALLPICLPGNAKTAFGNSIGRLAVSSIVWGVQSSRHPNRFVPGAIRDYVVGPAGFGFRLGPASSAG